jgi:hypothetical protein
MPLLTQIRSLWAQIRGFGCSRAVRQASARTALGSKGAPRRRSHALWGGPGGCRSAECDGSLVRAAQGLSHRTSHPFASPSFRDRNPLRIFFQVCEKRSLMHVRGLEEVGWIADFAR